MAYSYIDYSMFLYGLSDCNHNVVHASTVSNDFVKYVDDYLLRMGYDLSDFYLDDRGIDVNPLFIKNLIYAIGLDLGLSTLDIMSIIDDLDANGGRPIHPLSSDDDDDDSNQQNSTSDWSWLLSGFSCIFSQNIDFNANYQRYLDQRHNPALDEAMMMKQLYDKGLKKDRERTVSDLSDKHRRDRLSSTYGLSRDSVAHLEQIGYLLSYIYHNDDDELMMELYYKDLFEKHLNELVSNWGVSREQLQNKPALFNDLLALSINRTLDELNPNIQHNEGHELLNWVFVDDLDDDSVDYVNQYSENYQKYYGVPIDASLYTVNEINEQMGRELFDEQYGSLPYHDIYGIKSESDLARFARSHNYKVNHQRFKSMDEIQQTDRQLFHDLDKKPVRKVNRDIDLEL